MMRTNIFLAMITVTFFSFLHNSLYAKRFKIYEFKTTYSRDILFGFSDRAGMDNDAKRMAFFLSVSEDDLNEVANKNGITPEVEEIVIFVDSESGDFRSDVTSKKEKMSIIFVESTKMMCYIDWRKSTYFCMPVGQIQQAQKDAQKMLSQMPDIEKMLENIPDPAQREAAMKALKDAQKSGMSPIGELPSGKEEIEISKTGKTRTQDGDVQYQVKFSKGNQNGIAWITKKYPKLTEVAQKIAANMKESFGPMAGDDIRSQIKDGFPVEIRTFEQNMMRGQANLEIEKVTKIEEGFSGNPFDFDKSKLKEQNPMGMPKM